MESGSSTNLFFRIYAKLRSFLILIGSYLFDCRRFMRHSGMVKRRTSRIAAAAFLTMYSHRIEKGLSLRETKKNFGEPVVQAVTNGLVLYIRKYGFDSTAAYCWTALKDYHRFNERKNSLSQDLYDQFRAIVIDDEQLECAAHLAATQDVEKERILEKAEIDFQSFVESRHSLRNFAERPVSLELVKKAAEMAQRTPSVCNRQCWRLHVYQAPEIKERVISCQGGNQGFGEQIDTVLLIASEIEHFFSPVERNQGFIDGGLYCMSLVYALHSLGLGTCCLNLSLSPEQEKRLCKKAEIGPNEMPIMMIAVGHYPERFKIASSRRKSVDQTMSIHG